MTVSRFTKFAVFSMLALCCAVVSAAPWMSLGPKRKLETLEDRLRLLYVALTRARNSLFVSGGITEEMLRPYLPSVKLFSGKVKVAPAPGMKYKHYAPKTPFLLMRGDSGARKRFLSEQTGRFAVLAYTEDVPVYRSLASSPTVFDLGPEADPGTQLHRLFYLLREADKTGCERLYAPLPATTGLSLALYNRMIRAAAYQIISID